MAQCRSYRVARALVVACRSLHPVPVVFDFHVRFFGAPTFYPPLSSHQGGAHLSAVVVAGLQYVRVVHHSAHTQRDCTTGLGQRVWRGDALSEESRKSTKNGSQPIDWPLQSVSIVDTKRQQPGGLAFRGYFVPGLTGVNQTEYFMPGWKPIAKQRRAATAGWPGRGQGQRRMVTLPTGNRTAHPWEVDRSIPDR